MGQHDWLRRGFDQSRHASGSHARYSPFSAGKSEFIMTDIAYQCVVIFPSLFAKLSLIIVMKFLCFCLIFLSVFSSYLFCFCDIFETIKCNVIFMRQVLQENRNAKLKHDKKRSLKAYEKLRWALHKNSRLALFYFLFAFSVFLLSRLAGSRSFLIRIKLFSTLFMQFFSFPSFVVCSFVDCCWCCCWKCTLIFFCYLPFH